MTEQDASMAPAAQGLMRVARSVLSDLDLEVILTRVLDSARELTGARYAALGVLDEAKRQLARFLTVGLDEETAQAIGPRPTGRGVLGELITHPVPLRADRVGSHPRSYGFPTGHPPMETFLGVPIVIRGEPFGNLYLTDKLDGELFTEEDEQAVQVLAELAGLAIEHARRFTDSEDRRVELQRTVDALEATMEIAGALAGESEIDAILELVAKRGRALVGARILAIEIQEGAELAVAAGAGELPSDFVGRRFAIQETVASTALRTRRTQRLSDELNRSRFEQHGLGRFDLQVSDGLVVPMIFRGEPYGVLLALDRYGGPAFEPDQERLLEAFASSAAVVVATARSAADERRRQVMAAAEAERGRWARELHDETLQAIASVRLMLSAARRVSDAEEMRASIEAAMDELQTDMDNLRALITDLRPGALDQLGIEPALIDLTERVGASGIDLDVNIDLSFEQGRADRRLAPDLETAIYRTVQEALTNVAKHAGADRAVVEVVEEGATVSVRIRDNGRGFDPHDETEGFGLLGMQERVELVDGHLTVDSSAGRGTTVTAEFPVRRRARPTPARAAG